MEHCPHCGCELPKPGKPRSIDQHRRYFAMIAAAFHHWPNARDRQFTSSEELRKWAQMKAGYREIGAQIPLSGIGREKALMLVEAAIRASGSYAVPVLHGDTLVVFRPKSIAFGKLAHIDACKLFDDVAAIIEQEVGVSADRLLKETAGAA